MSKLDFDLRFQENLVRLLHQDKGFAEAALIHLKPTQFENSVHSWVVRQMQKSLQLNGTLPDLLILSQERRKAELLGSIRKEDRAAYRSFLANKLKKPVANRTYIKKELQNFVKNQAWKAFILDAVDSHLPKKQWEEVAKKAHQVLNLDVTGDYSLGSRPGATYKKRIREREKVQARGVTTGVMELDRLMVRRGLVDKQLGTLIAPTGRGKTNFLINLAAEAVLDGVPTLYVSLELDEDTIMTRMDARFTGVPLRLLKNNREDVLAGWRRVRNRVKKNLVVKEFPAGSTTVAMLRQHIRRLEREAFYPKLIIVDYADLLKASVEYADSSYETQGQVYLDLLGLLAELKAVGWTATQGNRKSMGDEAKGDVDLSMMADSVKKAMHAFVVLGIAQSPKEKKFKKGRIVVLKNRNGPADRELKVSIEHDTVVFKSMTS